MALNEFDFAEIPLKWSPGDIKCLIDLYGQHSQDFDSFQKNKVWDEIAKKISQIRCKKISADQCNGKWKGLKSSYKKIKDHNNTSGNSRKDWEHYQAMDELLDKRPEVSPPAICSNHCDEVIISAEKDYNFSDIMVDESNICKENLKVRKRKAKPDVDSVRQQRHREKMEKTDQYLALFQTLVSHVVQSTSRESANEQNF